MGICGVAVREHCDAIEMPFGVVSARGRAEDGRPMLVEIQIPVDERQYWGIVAHW